MEEVLLWLCIGLVAAFVARLRGYHGWKWFLTSLLFGPLAFIIIFLPNHKKG